MSNVSICADCGEPIRGEPWELEDGRTVCEACCGEDLGRILDMAIGIASGETDRFGGTR